MTFNESGSYLYADDICIFKQDKDIHKIEDVLNQEFSKLSECFADNKLTIYFGEVKLFCCAISEDYHSLGCL